MSGGGGGDAGPLRPCGAGRDVRGRGGVPRAGGGRGALCAICPYKGRLRGRPAFLRGGAAPVVVGAGEAAPVPPARVGPPPHRPSPHHTAFCRETETAGRGKGNPEVGRGGRGGGVGFPPVRDPQVLPCPIAAVPHSCPVYGCRLWVSAAVGSVDAESYMDQVLYMCGPIGVRYGVPLLWALSSGCSWVLAAQALHVQVLEVRAVLAPHGDPMGWGGPI